jgi:cytochrome c oxidase subunit 4
MDAEIRDRLLVWLALLALLALTVAMTFAPIGAWHLAVSLAIAAAKAGLIAWVFMDLRKAAGAVRLTAVAPLVLLMVLFVLPSVDAAVRGR